MLAIAGRGQRTLTGLEESRFQRHLSECLSCQELESESKRDWQAVARLPDDAFDDPNLLVLPVVDPNLFDRHQEMASGGMGRITRANDRRLGREVAIKEVLELDLHARFEREALITARLQHPAIIPIYEAGRWPDGSVFYTMRLVSGGTLAESIARAKTMPQRVALVPHVTAVTDALAYAHSRRIIHRDLKPGNVLVGPFGETVVIDWGLAKELDHSIDDAPSAGSEPSLPNLTRAGSVLGTPGFMSPEQASGDHLDARADVYALGSILYNVLTGVPPYYDKHPNDTPELVMELVRIRPPTPIAALAPDVPADLRAIVERAMGPINARYPTANEMAEELRRFQTGRLIAAREYSLLDLVMRWIRRHRAAVTVGLVAFVALAAVAISAFISISDSRTQERLQRTAAEVSLATALEEQARTELLVGDHERGLVYASEAYRRGRDTPALRYLLAVATRDAMPAPYTIGPPQLTSPCTGDPSCADSVVESVGFAADGQLVLVEAGGRISHWRDGKQTSSIALGTTVSSAQLDPAVERAAVAGEHSLGMWDVQTGANRWLVSKSSLVSPRLKFDPSGKRLVALTEDDDRENAPVFDTDTGAVVATIDVGAQPVADAAFSPSGHLLAACGADGTVRVWDITSFTTVATWNATPAETLTFAGPDELVIGSEIWRISDGKRVRTLAGDAGLITLGSTDSGDLIATSADRAVRLWNRDGTLLAESTVPHGRMNHLLFGPGVLVGAGNDSQIYVWDVPSLELRRAITAHEGATDLVALDRTGTRIVTSGLTDGRVREWAMPLGSRIVHVSGTAADFTTGGQWLAVRDSDVTIRGQDTGAEVRHIALDSAFAHARIEVSRDGRRALLVDRQQSCVIDLASDVSVELATGWITKLSADGRFVLDVSQVGDNLDDVVHVIDADTRRVVLELKFPHTGAPTGGDISPDGQRIALGFGTRIMQWKVPTGDLLGTVNLGGAPDDYQPHFDPTGATLIVTGTNTNVAIVYDTASGHELTRFADTAPIVDLSFSRDASRVLTYNANDVVHLWDPRRKLVLASVSPTRVTRSHSAQMARASRPGPTMAAFGCGTPPRDVSSRRCAITTPRSRRSRSTRQAPACRSPPRIQRRACGTCISKPDALTKSRRSRRAPRGRWSAARSSRPASGERRLRAPGLGPALELGHVGRTTVEALHTGDLSGFRDVGIGHLEHDQHRRRRVEPPSGPQRARIVGISTQNPPFARWMRGGLSYRVRDSVSADR